MVPSVDTPVCEMQTKRFNEEANNAEITIITISMDLPFARSDSAGRMKSGIWFCFLITGIMILPEIRLADRNWAC